MTSRVGAVTANQRANVVEHRLSISSVPVELQADKRGRKGAVSALKMKCRALAHKPLAVRPGQRTHSLSEASDWQTRTYPIGRTYIRKILSVAKSEVSDSWRLDLHGQPAAIRRPSMHTPALGSQLASWGETQMLPCGIVPQCLHPVQWDP